MKFKMIWIPAKWSSDDVSRTRWRWTCIEREFAHHSAFTCARHVGKGRWPNRLPLCRCSGMWSERHGDVPPSSHNLIVLWQFSFQQWLFHHKCDMKLNGEEDSRSSIRVAEFAICEQLFCLFSRSQIIFRIAECQGWTSRSLIISHISMLHNSSSMLYLMIILLLYYLTKFSDEWINPSLRSSIWKKCWMAYERKIPGRLKSS